MLGLTQARPSCAAQNQSSTLKTNLHSCPLWIEQSQSIYRFAKWVTVLCQTHSVGWTLVIKYYRNYPLALPFSGGVGFSF